MGDNYEHYTIRRNLLRYVECEQLVDWIEDGTPSSGVKEEVQGQFYRDIPYEETSFEPLYNKLSDVIDEVNIWDFDLGDWEQPLRVSRYDVGAHMDWHQDYVAWDGSKIAFSIPIVSRKVWKGGEFELFETKTPDLSRGDALFFPAYHMHRVLPVTAGSRYVLLGWVSGPRFI